MKLEDEFQLGFTDEHFHFIVERAGSRIAFPDVEGDIIASGGFGIIANEFEQFGSDMMFAESRADAEIVDIKRGMRDEVCALFALDCAENVSGDVILLRCSHENRGEGIWD